MGADVNYPTSDTQFLAQVLLKTRRDDILTVDEEHRLQQIADTGFSSQPVPINTSGGGT